MWNEILEGDSSMLSSGHTVQQLTEQILRIKYRVLEQSLLSWLTGIAWYAPRCEIIRRPDGSEVWNIWDGTKLCKSWLWKVEVTEEDRNVKIKCKLSHYPE